MIVEARQILRWGIPGWIFVLMLLINFVLLMLLSYLIKTIENDFLIFTKFISGIISASSSFLPLLVIILGIPLGYIIYHAYNVFHYRCGTGLKEEFEDLFNEVEKKFDDDKNFDEKISKTKYKNYKKDIRYAKLYYKLHNFTTEREKVHLTREQDFSNLSHSFGASIFALASAIFIYLIIIFIFIFLDIPSRLNIATILIAILPQIFLSCLIYIALKKSRSKVKLNQMYIIYKLFKRLEKKLAR